MDSTIRRFAARGLPTIAIIGQTQPKAEVAVLLDAGACQVLRAPVTATAMELAVVHTQHSPTLTGGATTAPVNGAYREMLRALGSALDTRDPETQEHAIRVVRYALKLGETLGMTDAQLVALERGAILHDVGKIGVPDGILMKPGYLSEAEWHCMRSHPEIGHDMLSSISFLADALPVIRYHHERYDGSGYPQSLAGDQIPFGARIFAVVDALDAMTSERPYRRAMSLEDAVEEIARCAGTHFDPRVADALVQLVRSGDWPHDG